MATERIIRMAELSKKINMYPEVILPEYGREYMLMGKLICNAQRARAYMNAQTVNLNEDDRFAGRIKFDDDRFPGIIFTRRGFKHHNELNMGFYKKPFADLNSVDAQHSTPDYATALKLGFRGIKEKIRRSAEKHSNDRAKTDYLKALDIAVGYPYSYNYRCCYCRKSVRYFYFR